MDHIIPIDAGGRTMPSNLRTLCSDCNLGKSNAINVNDLPEEFKDELTNKGLSEDEIVKHLNSNKRENQNNVGE